MTITEVKIRSMYAKGNMRALASIVIDGELAVHDLKVIQGANRLFIAMPSRKDDNGQFRDTVHPMNSTIRQKVEDAVLAAYQKAVEKATDGREAVENGKVQ